MAREQVAVASLLPNAGPGTLAASQLPVPGATGFIQDAGLSWNNATKVLTATNINAVTENISGTLTVGYVGASGPAQLQITGQGNAGATYGLQVLPLSRLYNNLLVYDNGVIIMSGSAANLTVSGPAVATVLSAGAIYSATPGDVNAVRGATGFIFLGNTGHYLGWQGSQYQFVAGPVDFNGYNLTGIGAITATGAVTCTSVVFGSYPNITNTAGTYIVIQSGSTLYLRAASGTTIEMDSGIGIHVTGYVQAATINTAAVGNSMPDLTVNGAAQINGALGISTTLTVAGAYVYIPSGYLQLGNASPIIYLTTSGTRYLNFDGTNYNMPNADAYIGRNLLSTVAGSVGMTQGFIYIPTMSGAAGSPGYLPGGRVPMYYDYNLHRLNVWDLGAGAWHGATFS